MYETPAISAVPLSSIAACCAQGGQGVAFCFNVDGDKLIVPYPDIAAGPIEGLWLPWKDPAFCSFAPTC